ncbi:HNH/ENDO VII family nuclease [Bacterioplanoides sp.]|uniref:HNH/ENDO VII family nuclease n=1 Tax=Bacterioplanoides sp. TaxID=2066072 RepID=UPI003AFFA033
MGVLLSTERGQPPVGVDGKKIELHHRNQNPDGPLDELTNTTHKNVDHPKKVSEIDRNKFKGERRRYWVERARELLGK